MPDTPTAEAVRTTLEDLQRGLAQIPRARAAEHVERWRDALAASDRPDLHRLADDLDRLHALLSEATPDPGVVGPLLARLGEQTIAAAQDADPDDAGRTTERLGLLLFHAGHALAGPRPA